MPSPRQGDRRSDEGSVTAEFAVMLPVVGLLLALCLGALQLGSAQVRLADSAADAARLVGRGDTAAAESRVTDAVPGARLAVTTRGAVVCVTVSATPRAALLGALFDLSAHGCALDDREPAP